MGPRPVGTPDPVSWVTYNDTNGVRKQKKFTVLTQATAFYRKMFREGRDPHIHKEPQL